jgi:hypothetical protein
LCVQLIHTHSVKLAGRIKEHLVEKYIEEILSISHA